MKARVAVRRAVPLEIRIRLRSLARAVGDRGSGLTFAAARASVAGFPNLVCRYERRFIDYPGQEQLAAAKRQNQRLLAAELDGLVIGPGEVFSVWRTAKRPTARRGYASAAALKNGVLTTDTGGAICLLSTVLYNVGLLGALEIVERHCHSVDSYGENRYFELARDAAIEFPYLDLRLRNPHTFPVRLSVRVDDDCVAAELCSPVPHGFAVTISAQAEPVAPDMVVEFDPYLPPGTLVRRRRGVPGLRVESMRTVVGADGSERTEPLPDSYHRPSPEIWASGDRPSQRWQRAYDAPLGGRDAGDERQRMGDPL
jgi:hypothetical protein